MDVVWIRLNAIIMVQSANTCVDYNEDEYFMFGPTGIVRFKRVGSVTQLLNSSKIVVAEVSDEPEYIMNILRKMRGTEGRLSGKNKEQKKENSKVKASRAKKNS